MTGWGNRIRGVALDYGEVLCVKPGPEILRRMAGALGIGMEGFEERYYEERGAYDRGDLEPAEYWARVAQRPLPGNAVLENLRQWDIEMWSHIEPRMTAWLGALKAAGYRTALLSNMHEDMIRHFRRSFPWLQQFDCQVFSCEAHQIKPERGIFELCLEQLGLPAGDVLFLDDREANVQAALEVGIVALRFESVERLRGELMAAGFPVRPAGNGNA
jgi:putative hydrolase of the HAD superfamily